MCPYVSHTRARCSIGSTDQNMRVRIYVGIMYSQTLVRIVEHLPMLRSLKNDIRSIRTWFRHDMHPTTGKRDKIIFFRLRGPMHIVNVLCLRSKQQFLIFCFSLLMELALRLCVDTQTGHPVSLSFSYFRLPPARRYKTKP